MRRLRVVECAVQIAPFIKVISLGLLVSACAASHASYDHPANVGAGTDRRVAVAIPPKIEIEDDGLAVQSPPKVRRRIEPDDPSEPFSPNYGPAPLPGEIKTSPERPPRQAQLHEQLRPRTKPMTDRQASALIARAMIEHEQRYP